MNTMGGVFVLLEQWSVSFKFNLILNTIKQTSPSSGHSGVLFIVYCTLSLIYFINLIKVSSTSSFDNNNNNDDDDNNNEPGLVF